MAKEIEGTTIFPIGNRVYPDGAVIIEEKDKPIRVLRHSEFEAEIETKKVKDFAPLEFTKK